MLGLVSPSLELTAAEHASANQGAHEGDREVPARVLHLAVEAGVQAEVDAVAGVAYRQDQKEAVPLAAGPFREAARVVVVVEAPLSPLWDEAAALCLGLAVELQGAVDGQGLVLLAELDLAASAAELFLVALYGVHGEEHSDGSVRPLLL